MKTAWTWLNANSNALTVAFAVLAGLWVLVEIYFVEPARGRREAAVRYENIFNDPSSPVSEARITLDRFWDRNHHLSDGKRVAIECYPELNNAALRVVDHSQEILRLHGFYENLARCVLDGYCAQARSCKTFEAHVLDFWWSYSIPLDEWGADLGRSLDVYLRDFTQLCGTGSRIPLTKKCEGLDPSVVTEIRK